MRATEIIRDLLDIIDQIEPQQENIIDLEPMEEPQEPEIITLSPESQPSDRNHFKQIFDFLSSQNEKMYSNSPDEIVSGIESVTVDAGGGVNGPKNPADIRADSVSMYPFHQHRPL